MYRYRIGRVEGSWHNLVPPIQGGIYTLQRDGEKRRDSGVEATCEVACGETCCIAGDGTSCSAVNHTSAPDQCAADLVQAELEADLAKYPSLDAAAQRNIAKKFDALHKRIQGEGFYDCRFSEYGKELSRYTLLFALFAGFLSQGWYITSACFLGVFWHQIMFTAHDAGHRGITHDITTDTLIGIFIGNLCCGLSIGWWKSSHNVHHLVTNHPVRLKRSPSGLASC